MSQHTTTDPTCMLHREPRTWWQRRRFDRNRGRACNYCLFWNSRRAFLERRGFSRGEASALATIEMSS